MVTVYVPGIVKLKDFDVPVTVVVAVPLSPVPVRETIHSLLGAGTWFGAVLRFHVIVRDCGDGVAAVKTTTWPFDGLVITGVPMFGADVQVTPVGRYVNPKFDEVPVVLAQLGGSFAAEFFSRKL